MTYQPRPLMPTRYLPSPTSSPSKLEIKSNTDFKIPPLPRYRLMTPSTSTVAASSSPIRSSPIRREPIREVYLQSDKITVLGRHKSHPTSSLPPSIHDLLIDPSRRVESVHLPRSASHASRIHCAVEVTENGIRIAVVGQNGVRVKQAGRKVRMKKGECRVFDREVEVDFYGCKVRLVSIAPSRSTLSPAPSVPVAAVESIPHSPAADPEVPPPPVDLPALLASTVVFSGSSKLSLPDLVKHMLEAQPSLKEHGTEAQWSVWASAELEGNQMFGKVQRSGKDSSGHPLLPHYFYVPDADPDTSRAKQLGGLVRPLRAAQRAGGKAIDWRPVGSGRRRY
ncbi:uncharacterized protein MKK02DRAFT_45247 [Dioszegia hungarica]|uniref:FHA domain-containing protein n=1 Tax=Dioszegia hungarica TaxID=4972 RepID=A0AA38H9Z2_9TREE|nr:uncharacterized protein MKK02DRAFT_45247 [Dioszegia hungarica]KAI9636543.1 hypothetical protein MKK02DRAFT_45247 [Dioszegia hungarica]